MEKLIYIPWFWNFEDDIIKNKFKEITNKYILQYNLRWIDYKKVKSFLENSKNINKVYEKYDISKLKNKKITSLDLFKWFTRTIDLTVKLTSKRISNLINNEWNYILAWHSQWWLILIETILKNPNLLDKIKKIELLAPVISYEIWYKFHKWMNKSYFLPYWKNVVVREKYINELKNSWTENKLYNFLNLLKQKNWSGELELFLWEKDNVISKDLFDLNKIKEIYPNIKIKIIENADHYLWFKKK